MKKSLFYIVFGLLTFSGFAQNGLENIGILIPKELKEWEFTKGNIQPQELFKNAASVKSFITQRNEPVRIYEFYKYHPESNKALIPQITFYVFANNLPIGDYPNMVAEFFSKNMMGLENVKNIANETFLNGNSPEYVQHYSYVEPMVINNKTSNINVNVVQALVFKDEYILFIDGYQPVEPTNNSAKTLDDKAKKQMVELIKNIKITETIKIE
ncbi:hypothetical protein K5I29_11105 [Flavobacterium agricola]|uniref:Uncharacterized protein n=1 Tax=Flavobacterium agricola TaxID=2870839 RepID=A0ABY6M033_9FLAO|nr:hypothetical protein [Flavobacterium agricola]UYW01029.1 hypothetical protein K5I29_11105 [Flavobacterium agricola]